MRKTWGRIGKGFTICKCGLLDIVLFGKVSEEKITSVIHVRRVLVSDKCLILYYVTYIQFKEGIYGLNRNKNEY